MTYVLRATFVCVVVLCVLAFARIVEPIFFPVVKDFQVDSVTREDGKLIVDGHMSKSRACEIKSVVVYGKSPKGVPVLFNFSFLNSDGKPRSELYNRATGYQKWGPWEIYLPAPDWAGELMFYTLHSCWPLWSVETHLTTRLVDE